MGFATRGRDVECEVGDVSYGSSYPLHISFQMNVIS